MTTILVGFLIGFTVPVMARRIIRIFPADAGTSLFYMLRPAKIRIRQASPHYKTYIRLFRKLIALSFLYGTFSAACAALIVRGEYDLLWVLAFVWMLLTLAEVDRRAMLLPDVLTVPLLITGFAYACFSAPVITPLDSAIGALFGYFAPVVCGALMLFYKRDTIGGGDIKILAALGAWLGIYHLAFALLVSLVVFAAFALTRKEKAGPYGPAISLAAIIALAVSHHKLLWPYIGG